MGDLADDTVESRIAGFVAAYDERMQGEIADSRRRMQALFPRGVELVYDNYNSLVFAFGASERASQAVLSLACFPRWITLCFQWGVRLDDPQALLMGEGSQVRHVRLKQPDDLEKPEIRALIEQACALAGAPLAQAGARYAVVKSVSARQRPRRPAGEGKGD